MTELNDALGFYTQGKDCYAQGDFAGAINNMNKALEIDPDYEPAIQMKRMFNQILDYRCVDIYNP